MFVKELTLKNFKSFKSANFHFGKGFASIVGPNGSGKSTAPDTKVILSSGKVCAIGDLVESQLQESDQLIVLDDGVMTLGSPGIKILGIDPSSMCLVEKEVRAFIKREGEPFLYKISTRSGKHVVATGCHPVMVYKNGCLTSSLVSDLRAGDSIASPRVLRLQGSEKEVAAPHDTAENGAFWEFKGKYPCAPARFPKKLGPEFARFLGYLVGDGSLCSTSKQIAFTNADVELIGDYTSLAERLFGKKPSARKYGLHGKASMVFFSSVFVSRCLKNLFENKFTGREKHVPLQILASTDAVAAEFLAALFDCDAYVSKTLPSFKYVTCSETLADQVQLMLLRFGIVAVKKTKLKRATNGVNKEKQPHYYLFIDGQPNLRKLADVIPMRAKNKVERLNYWTLRQAEPNPNRDLLPQEVNYYIKECVKQLGIACKPLRAEFPRFAAYVENRCAPTVYGINEINSALFGPKLMELRKCREQLTQSKESLLHALDLLGISRQEASRSIGLSQQAINNSWAYSEYNPEPASAAKLFELLKNELDRRIARCESITAHLASLVSSDIFWDPIVSIENVPGEKWVYDLEVEGCHNFVGNGLFIHNSNSIDALLFAFGENSLRSMRVKKIADLIFHTSPVAEVTLVLDDGNGGKHEIRRAVRRDGKVKYVLNGKRAKKYAVMEFLAQHALSTQNIIKQGEVQRIVEMNPKDRRTLIDVVANVSEYEQKKQEAYRELETVQERLREATAILNEREGFLEALQKEKEDAEKYLALKKQLDVLKASLLLVDIRVMEKEFKSAVAAMLDAQNKVDAAKKAIFEIGQAIAAKQAEKEQAHALIMQRSEGRQLVLEREVQELHTAVEKAKTLIEEKKAQVQRNEARLHELKLDSMRAGDEVKGAEARMKESRGELESLQKVYDEEKTHYDRVLKDSNAFSQQFHDARQALEKASAEMQACKDQLNALQAQVSVWRETAKMKEGELERLKTGDFIDYSGKKEELALRRKEAQKELDKALAASDALFAEEKRLNEHLKKEEQLLLQAKEKIYDLSNRLKHGKEFEVSRSLEAVLALQQKEKGIHGTLEQLCSYESKYAVPVQVALGPRANYVVVDSFRTASKAIDFLKQNKLGRVSFVPLDKIRGQEPSEEDGELKKKAGANALGFLIDFVEYDEKYSKAFRYAFGSTLLMKALAPAEPLVGKIRFVTM
ncbi:MAG: LAGLIDADG family homing endonuclease, partial [Candidatus Micrarchaeota archaeon]